MNLQNHIYLIDTFLKKENPVQLLYIKYKDQEKEKIILTPLQRVARHVQRVIVKHQIKATAYRTRANLQPRDDRMPMARVHQNRSFK